MLRALLTEYRLRREASQAWCAACRKRPRVTLGDGDDRYCSEECQEHDAEMQAHG